MSRHGLIARIRSGVSASNPACPIHGHAARGRRYISNQVISGSAAKALLPSMEDFVLWKGDTVTVAMSGGVDSAVTLRILSEWPLNINVVFMRNWDSLLSESNDSSEEEALKAFYQYTSNPSSSKAPNMSPCGWQKDWETVQKVCAHVGIPESKVRMVDLSAEYWSRVFEPALGIWESGGTPNPDHACNREIKFGALLDHIPHIGRSFLATGHYARVKRVPHATKLVRADDLNKDQTYYLSSISEPQLRRAIFPLARIMKPDVRKLAKYYGLPNADKAESMGLCFVGERAKFGTFISQYINKPTTQGYLVDKDGKRLAQHTGLWNYTEGQRAKIGGLSEPMFVAKKCIGENGQDILVVPGTNNPALLCTRLHTHDFHWIDGKVPKGMVPMREKKVHIQVRHRMEPVRAFATHDWDGAGITVRFQEPIHGVSPGQVCSIYYRDWCLGSGIIKETWTADTDVIEEKPKFVKRPGVREVPEPLSVGWDWDDLDDGMDDRESSVEENRKSRLTIVPNQRRKQRVSTREFEREEVEDEEKTENEIEQEEAESGLGSSPSQKEGITESDSSDKVDSSDNTDPSDADLGVSREPADSDPGNDRDIASPGDPTQQVLSSDEVEAVKKAKIFRFPAMPPPSTPSSFRSPSTEKSLASMYADSSEITGVKPIQDLTLSEGFWASGKSSKKPIRQKLEMKEISNRHPAPEPVETVSPSLAYDIWRKFSNVPARTTNRPLNQGSLPRRVSPFDQQQMKEDRESKESKESTESTGDSLRKEHGAYNAVEAGTGSGSIERAQEVNRPENNLARMTAAFSNAFKAAPPPHLDPKLQTRLETKPEPRTFARVQQRDEREVGSGPRQYRGRSSFGLKQEPQRARWNS